MPRRSSFRPLLALACLLAVVLAALAFARAAPEPDADETRWPPLAGEAVWSLLAVGDTGAEPWPFARSRQVSARVARALTAEDQRAPVAALVLLGDNFYPDGLRRDEFDARVRANLVEPFCRFLPSPEFTCPVPSRPARVLAVLGNHDHHSPESPALQRVEIERKLPSWFLPKDAVHGMELGEGVSLVLYDAQELLEAGSFEPLRAAVRASPGPWRILAGHYPLTQRESDNAGRAARAAIVGLDLPVHLHLAGHRHYLELAHTDAPPFLQAIAGSGSNTRLPKQPLEGSVYQAQLPGFARVDLVRGSDGDRLTVSLVALPPGLFPGDERPRVAARWSVGLAGGARAEPLAAE
jgi:hypothetical protein